MSSTDATEHMIPTDHVVADTDHVAADTEHVITTDHVAAPPAAHVEDDDSSEDEAPESSLANCELSFKITFIYLFEFTCSLIFNSIKNNLLLINSSSSNHKLITMIHSFIHYYF